MRMWDGSSVWDLPVPAPATHVLLGTCWVSIAITRHLLPSLDTCRKLLSANMRIVDCFSNRVHGEMFMTIYILYYTAYIHLDASTSVTLVNCLPG